jgi:WD40 repeat protein
MRALSPMSHTSPLRSTKKRKISTANQNDEYVCSLVASHTVELDSMYANIRSLYESQNLCDVSFKVEDQLFHAHRLILASTNSFLGAMILSGMQESEKTVIDIKGAPPHLFKLILDYIYGMRIEFRSSDLISLLGLADSYSMVALRDRLGDMLRQNLSVLNCCAIYAAADAHGCTSLKAQAQDLLFSNFAIASKTDGFYELRRGLLESVLASDEILDCDEALLFDAAVRWMERSTASQSECSAILKLIRFPLMDSCLLSDVIKVHPLMNTPERIELMLEAFEHHALRAAGRGGIDSSRTKRRRQSCTFTEASLLKGHSDAVSALLVYGQWLISASWDCSIKVWCTETWMCMRTLSDHSGAIRALCICSDKIVSCSEEGDIMVWTPGRWTCARVLEGHNGATNAIVQCKGRLASAGDDGAIKLWGCTSWACEVTVHQTPEGGERTGRVGVICLGVVEDHDILISGGDDSKIRIWNTNNWACERILRAHRETIWSICISPDGTLYTGSVNSTIRVWKRSHNDSSDAYSSDGSAVHPSARCPHGEGGSVSHPYHALRARSQHAGGLTTVTSSGSLTQLTYPTNTVRPKSPNRTEDSIGNSEEWLCQACIQSDAAVYALCCLDGLIVSAGAGNKISVWRAGRAEEEVEWSLHRWFDTTEESVWSLAVWKGRLISGGEDGTVRVWM